MVKMTISVAGLIDLIRSIPSIPLIPGKPMSRRITDGGESIARASRASSHDENACEQLNEPVPSRTDCTLLRYESLSSINQISTGPERECEIIRLSLKNMVVTYNLPGSMPITHSCYFQ